MRIFVTGDTHGTFDIGKVMRFFEGREDEFTKDDFLIICGDVGACGFTAAEEAETRRILRDLPVTVLWIDGNHENFDLLGEYPVDEWNGGKVHFICDDIIHLMRGQVFDIGGTTFFTFGGAYSIDRMHRIKGRTWFPEELPNKEEYAEGWRNLKQHDFEVDYILTHTAPAEIIDTMGYYAESDDEDELRDYLQKIADNTGFKAWYFGHFHEDSVTDEKFFCLYNDIIELQHNT